MSILISVLLGYLSKKCLGLEGHLRKITLSMSGECRQPLYLLNVLSSRRVGGMVQIPGKL